MDVQLTITTQVPQDRPKIAVLHLGGWLDAQGEERLVTAVRKARDEGAEYVVLDLSGVSTITSAGIRGIQRSFGIMAPGEEMVIGRLKLCSAPPQVYDVLSMTGILLSAPMYESADIAIDSFGQ